MNPLRIKLMACLLLAGILNGRAQQPIVESGLVPVAMSSGGGQFVTLYANLLNRVNTGYQNQVGSPYLSEDWVEARVPFQGQEYVFRQAKVDVLNNCLEVVLEGTPKILEARFFRTFTVQGPDGTSRQFLNGQDLRVDGEPLQGFVQQSQAGAYQLYTHIRARLVKPGQDAKIVGMDTREKIQQTRQLYLGKEGTLQPVKNKKQLLEALDGNHRRQAEKYLRDNKVDLKSEAELLPLLLHCQGL
jgi:hypothetical protein